MAGAVTDAMKRQQRSDEYYCEAMEHMRRAFVCVRKGNALRNNVAAPRRVPFIVRTRRGSKAA